MATLLADCPRCDASSMTFDVKAQTFAGTRYDWQHHYEVFAACRYCHAPTIFRVSQREIQDELNSQTVLNNYDGSINDIVQVERHISLRDEAGVTAPAHLPEEVKVAFDEAAACVAVGCPNAAAAVFRMALDLATRTLLPAEEVEGLNRRTRRDLGLRLPWLFDNDKLPGDLRDLSSCIREDGNDGAHAGTLTLEDAHDIQDFTLTLLERLYTEPGKLKRAAERRAERRKRK